MNIFETFITKELSVVAGAHQSPNNFEKISGFTRPAFIANPVFTVLHKQRLLEHIDTALDLALLDMLSAGELKDGERTYSYCKATEPTDDYKIITQLDIQRFLSLEEIFVTIGYLISEAESRRGVLYELSASGQENLNIGYYMTQEKFPKMMMVYLERKHKENNHYVYHIHEMHAPREYRKPNRHFLV